MRARIWLILIAALALFVLMLAALLLTQTRTEVARPGAASVGHADLDCVECHGAWSISAATLDQYCLDCHQDDIGGIRKAHSPTYLAAVSRISREPHYLSADSCVSCHRGHESATSSTRINRSLPSDFCVACHADVPERVNQGFAFQHRLMHDFE